MMDRNSKPSPGQSRAASVFVVTVLAGLSSPPALAQTATRDRPQADHCEKPDQSAQALFNQGVEAHRKLLFARAEAKYRKALKCGEHPYVRYVLSRARFAQGKVLDAYQHLQQALPGLRAEHRADAEAYRTELLRQLAQIEVRCTEPGARIALDGKAWLPCAASKPAIVEPGQHVLKAQQKAHVSLTRPIVLAPGKTSRVEIDLMSIADSTYTVRRWARWKPWSLAGGGLVMTIAGGTLLSMAESNFDEFDRKWSNQCAGLDGGCQETDLPHLTAQLHRARWQNALGQASFAVGGVALVSGLTLTILNRSQTRTRKTTSTADVTIEPLIAGGSIGLIGNVRF